MASSPKRRRSTPARGRFKQAFAVADAWARRAGVHRLDDVTLVSAAFAEWSREFLAVDLSSAGLTISDGSRADARPSAMYSSRDPFTAVTVAHHPPFVRTFGLHRTFPHGVVRMRVEAEGVTVFAVEFRGADVSPVAPTQRLFRYPTHDAAWDKQSLRAITPDEGQRGVPERVTLRLKVPARRRETVDVRLEAQLKGVMRAGHGHLLDKDTCVERQHDVVAHLKPRLRPNKEVLIAFHFAQLAGDPGFDRGVSVERA